MIFSRYCFSFVDIGGYGRDNDTSIFSQTDMYKAFTNNEMDIPEPESKHGIESPYVLVSDEIFPLNHGKWNHILDKVCQSPKKFLITGCHDVGEPLKHFWYSCSKMENFQKTNSCKPWTVEKIIKACECLHNYLKLTYSSHYVPDSFVDSEDNSGNYVPGDWRKLAFESNGTLHHVSRSGSNNYTLELREKLQHYFISHFKKWL